MPLPEYPYRIVQLARRAVDKYRLPAGLLEDFGPDTVDIPRIDAEFVHALDRLIRQDVLDEADRISRHTFRYFGLQADFGAEIDWHLDPKTGRSWPVLFWGDINYRDGMSIGGVKFAWELNRLHHFPILALAFVLTGDRRYEAEIYDQLESWLQNNPYPKGINWISGIELGIRIVNLVYSLKLVGYPDDPRRHTLIREFVYRHASHLHRYPSKYTSGANHALAEALGLYAAGVSFPAFISAGEWKQFGKEVLEREASRQIQADGSSFEHSIPYLQFVHDHYLVYFLLCLEHGEPVGSNIEHRLIASLNFIDEILDSAGNYPMIGDDDSGFLLKLWVGEHNNFLSILQSGSRLFGSSRSRRETRANDLKTSVLLANLPAREAKNREPEIDAPAASYKTFPFAGLTTFRTHEPFDVLLVANASPLGTKPLAAHGHADALSFWLSVDGHPIFVDPGTYLYHSGGKWRNYFRSTAAHNTVRIDETDQATMLADFIFDDFYEVYDIHVGEHPDGMRWSATHNGYCRLPDPVIHTRTIDFEYQNASIVLEDTIRCRNSHLAERYFHLHPSCQASLEANRVRVRVADVCVDLELESDDSQIEIISQDPGPRGGWYSAGFNLLEPTTTIRCPTSIQGDTILRARIQLLRVES